ncbi:LysM peptidoglycan-binding domain-containing protein [Streptomyces mutomycini]|uniref:LysM peptidoglycan-binding domain-containing protein n=1 Tax=Streptomyces mutomycini TaxID=284036 RepID=UPI0033C17D1B
MTTHTTRYTVQSGDTLTEIAEKYGTTIDQLVEWNGIDDPDVIKKGQKLIVDKGDTPQKTTYTVKSGDTLSEIASEYGTTIDQLVDWNGIDDPDVIQKGQKLIVDKSDPL